MKNYKSIDEIDEHLKLLRLQADIYKKRTEINTKLVKHALQPSNLVAEGIAMLGEKYLWQKVLRLTIDKISGVLKK